ncbi:MAG: Quinate/shikimate 5-dehydrogenase I delta (EC [uncultured Paraburkholderia sp.]|nr:MAG: Quinate/shikimate 5-dehydrogenase I delta (EC [uncultured Paraburkholderia sp.]CAH2943589.1 MAG: Quinate/shikimate 5-dehydrogenase I delta (EC [uncultured Paraburkholderia sp.]
MGAKSLTLFDVDANRAASLADELQKRFPASSVTAGTSLAAANGLIHATPTGMAKLPGLPLPAELLRRDLWVADIVYFPIRTALLQAAEALGCRTLSGGMAAYQAVDAMRIFRDSNPTPNVSTRIFSRCSGVDPAVFCSTL